MKQAIYLLLFLSFSHTSCLRKKESKNIEYCGTVSSTESNNHGSIQPAIFKAKCATCHMFFKESTGPKMENALDRIPSEKWLYSFLRNEDSLTQIKEPYTLTLQASFPLRNCHNDSSLTDLQIHELIEYIKQ